MYHLNFFYKLRKWWYKNVSPSISCTNHGGTYVYTTRLERVCECFIQNALFIHIEYVFQFIILSAFRQTLKPLIFFCVNWSTFTTYVFEEIPYLSLIPVKQPKIALKFLICIFSTNSLALARTNGLLIDMLHTCDCLNVRKFTTSYMFPVSSNLKTPALHDFFLYFLCRLIMCLVVFHVSSNVTFFPHTFFHFFCNVKVWYVLWQCEATYKQNMSSGH